METMKHGTKVEVQDRGRWWPTVVDCSMEMPRFGWVMVAGIAGRAGPFVAHASNVRMRA